MTQQPQQQWGSRLGVILAVSGSAVGLGNFLRFPGQAAQNGGGSFMIPYFLALLLLGIPIGWAEWAMGRYGGRKGFHSAPAIMGVVGKGSIARYLGVIGVLIPLGVYFYYILIESWCLAYAWDYFVKGGIGLDAIGDVQGKVARSTEHFTKFTGQEFDGVMLDGKLHESVVFWAIVFAINVVLVYRGISKGIEKFCSFAMPVMAVCALVVLARVLTLGTPDAAHPDQNVWNGLGQMWNPSWDVLGNPGTWLAAAGQIFFSLSVGFGVIINYASYMKRKDDVIVSGLTSSATNELFEVGFGGMITIPAAFVFLGATTLMVNQNGQEVAMNAFEAAKGSSTFSLGFATLPVVFDRMPAGNLIGGFWFFMLFLAAITSSLSMLQPTLAFFEEALGWSRKKCTTLLVGVSLVGSSFVLYYSKGLTALGILDDWVGTLGIFVLATVQIICFGWVFGMDRGWKEMHEGAQLRLWPLFRVVIRYVTPLFLLLVFAAFCMNNLPDWVSAVAANPVKQMSVGLIVATILMLVVITRIGEKRWRAMGLDLDGKLPPADEMGMKNNGGAR
jgi:neurotransmitter:Na+ symporter, NSS family